MEIVRRACHDVTSTSFANSPVRPKQLSYSSLHDEVETNLQPPAVGKDESTVRGRSTTARYSTESPPTRPRVRWRSPSTDNDEFFDARQSLSRSRSRTSESRDRRSTHQVLQLVSDLQTQVTTVATIRMVRSRNVVAVDAVVHPHSRPTAVNQRPVLSRGRNG